MIMKGLDKCFRYFFVVIDFVDFVVCFGSIFGIDVLGKVVKLRGCEDFVVGEFGVGSFECIGECSNEFVVRGMSIVVVDDMVGSV